MKPLPASSCKLFGYALLPLTIASPLPLTSVQADDLSVTPASAVSDNDESAFKLSNVQVTAERLVTATEKTANEEGSVSEIDAQQLKNTVAYSADDLFRYDPSILTTNNGRFGLSGFNVRGLDENRISLQLDGLEMAESYGPTQAGTTPMLALRRAIVVTTMVSSKTLHLLLAGAIMNPC